ncbi:MAG: ABC transporter permease, partial [Synergistaceae bacterium]|nr:ABC transporter permease [Candidatus Equadaptatus faecalis]
MKNSRLRALVVKEFKQTLRDKITLAILLVMPIVELFIIGFAVNMDIKHVWTAVFDQSRSQDSREMIRSFTSSNYFDIKLYANSVNEVNEAVQAGYAKIGLIIPSDYASKIHGGRNTKLQVIVDATDSLSANSAMAAAQTLGILKSNELLRQQAMRHGINLSGQLVEMRTKLWYNPDFVTSWYMIPGIMGLLLSISLITLMGMAIVREAEQGTLEQLLVTPMQAWELLLSKICPYIIIGYLQIVLSLAIGMIFFDMPFVGSMPLFMLLTFFYVVSDLAFGIMISTFSDNQLQALQLSTFIILPSVMLSGFIFPIESMPKF